MADSDSTSSDEHEPEKELTDSQSMDRQTSDGRADVKVVITGGGTAGHTNPGIAVAQALVEIGLSADEVHFVGAQRGSEKTLVPEAGFTIDVLPGRGIKRSLSPDNFGAVFGLLSALIRSITMISRRKPQAVLCLGGYAAFAMSAAAVLRRVPLVVSEQNARASAVNKLFGRWAKVCALPFPDTDLPKGELTGNPIRAGVLESVANQDSNQAREILEQRTGLSLSNSEVLIAVWAGSLGATKINEAVRELAELWRTRDDIAIYHVVGRRDWNAYQTDQRQIESGHLRSGPNYVTVEYESDMPVLLSASEIAVCRSGASTVSELAVAGVPSILIPLPHAPRDHQRANTRELAEVGAAIVASDADLSGQYLAELLEPLVTERSERETMAKAAMSVARPDAALEVANLLVSVGGIDVG